MIKTEITCDKCGRKIEGQEHFYLVAMQEKYLKCPGLVFTESTSDKILCMECAESIQNPEMKQKKEAAVAEKKAAAAAEKKEAAVKKVEVAPVQPEVKESKAKRVDSTLVKVLLNKGWSKAKIAKEMGVTPAAISQAVKRIEGKEL